MNLTTALGAATASPLSDEEIVERVRGGETALYEILMRTYNQRLYRIARGVVGSAAEAEDVMQEAYVRAFTRLNQFAGRARFSTWLTKIAIHEALMRVRRRAKCEKLGDSPAVSTEPNPEEQVSNAELRRLLESAIDSLPENYRLVFVLREINELSTAEAAACLGISPKAVKIRLHRARAFLRQQLVKKVTVGAREAYPFHLSRCDRVVAAVFARLPAWSWRS